MIPTATIVTCFITLLISLVLPAALIFLYARKYPGEKLFKAWLLGAAGFFVTQILIRVPILTWVQMQPRFLTFSENHGFLFAFFLAFTAGLFELAGRFAAAKSMAKNLTFRRSIAAGLGHGGIEAMLLIGMTYVNNLIYISMIRAGTFDALIAQAAASGVDVSQLYMLKESLISTSPALFLMAGFERILTMICHLGMSLIVCYSLHTGKPLKGALACLGIHTLIDLSAGINMLIGTKLTQTAAYAIIYTILTITAFLSAWIVCKIRRCWTEKEVSHESERA